MDLENNPNKQGTRIGGGYMVVVYGSGDDDGGIAVVMTVMRRWCDNLWTELKTRED